LNLIGGLDESAQPRLLAIQVALAEAVQARSRLRIEKLTPNLRDLIVNRVDPVLAAVQKDLPMQDALILARVAPRLLAAGENRARTYLIMIQNEDELRATGGYLTAIGTLKLQSGKIQSIKLESSELLDDMTKVFPAPPWPMAYYMNADVMNTAQANWYIDFPTTVKWVRYMYDYFRGVRVDGVIAIDQEALVRVLAAVGPLNIPGISVPISDQNVLEYMRTAKIQKPPPGVNAQTWDRKQFLGNIAAPLAAKILSAETKQLSQLLQAMRTSLDERHMLLQFDDPELAPLLARREWDGAVRVPVNSDFIMAVDSNFGFNKTDLVVDRAMSYEIDLRDPARPLGKLSLTHMNKAEGNKPCVPGYHDANFPSSDYPVNDCYWNYLRVYPLRQAQLTSASPHDVSAAQMARGEGVAARVDDLLNEIDEPIGTHPFGTFIVVPQGQKIETSFVFELPGNVITKDTASDAFFYSLKVQKQPGIGELPFRLCVQIPDGATIVYSSILLDPQAGNCAVMNLSQDLYFSLSFNP